MTNRRQKGFTLVELTLVMAFMSILLLAILYMTLHIGKIYTKGLTNKTINQIGRDLSDTMRRDFAHADPALIQIPPATGSGDATSGRLCLGAVSYAWNTSALLDSTNTKITSNSQPITFVRVVDPDGSLCSPSGGPYPTAIPASSTLSEMLTTGGRDFALYSASITALSTSGTQGLYQIKLTVGTNEKNTTTKDETGTFVQCRPPTDTSANFDYCSVSDFDLIVRAGGSGQ